MAGMKMFCSVCNLSVNSSKQYLFHLQGKAHKRKEKEASSGGSVATSQHTPVIKIVRPNPMIRFVTSENCSSNSDPSQNSDQIVACTSTINQSENSAQNQTSVTNPAKNDRIFCSICVVQLTSQKLADMHYAGVKHKRAVALAGRSMDNASGGVKRKSEEMCDVCNVCNVPLKSKAVAEAHYAGSKHEKKLKLSRNINTANPYPTFSITQSPLKQQKVDPGNIFFCNYCNVSVNSQAQLDAHRKGGKHKSIVSGTPQQPKQTFTAKKTFAPRQQTFTPRQQTSTHKQQTFVPGLQQQQQRILPPRQPPPPLSQDHNRYFNTSFHFQNPENYASPNMSMAYRQGPQSLYEAYPY